ncbi:MAG TPA: hypothetical protein VFH80_01210 [Solirubrobacteraceae bacterium]|nr:hypothetical protein [Solirubrobacteraceae bacterium]
MRVAHLIIPSLAALALAGATSASARTGGGATPSAGGASAGAPTGTTSTASPSTPSPTALPSYSGPTQGPGDCAPTPTATATSGGVGVGGANATSAALPCPHPTVAGDTAQIINGLAYAPSDAPLQVQEAIWAGDRIRLKPYRVGGGHGKWNDSAYDCSGTVSYVLHAAGLLKVSEDSGQMETLGRRGAGQWITVYTNPGHAFIEIAGIRLDTSAEQDPHPAPGTGPRWRPLMTSTTGFMARHPLGL